MVILHPSTSWGERITRVFGRQWQALGGTIVAPRTFEPSAVDASKTVRTLSRQTTGTDFVFLVATSEQARQFWPEIRDKIGGKQPVYSTPHIYSGRFDPERDKDLVGLNFVEIPWLIESSRKDPVSSGRLHKKLPQFYAMGVDAYRFSSRLERISADAQARIPGKTGILGLDAGRRVHRELTLAHMGATGPRPKSR